MNCDVGGKGLDDVKVLVLNTTSCGNDVMCLTERILQVPLLGCDAFFTFRDDHFQFCWASIDSLIQTEPSSIYDL